MHRFTRILALLAVCCWAITGCGSGFEPGTTGTAESAFSFPTACSVTTPYISPSPSIATYPIGSQHVYCAHQPTDFGPSNRAPSVAPCTVVNGNQVPGVGQVDVWIRDAYNEPATHHYCARVTVPQSGSYHLTYWEVMAMGWYASGASNDSYRWLEGISVGEGVAWLLSSDSDVLTHGCPSGPPQACASGVNWLDSHTKPWFPLTGYSTVMSLNFQPVGCSYPQCD